MSTDRDPNDAIQGGFSSDVHSENLALRAEVQDARRREARAAVTAAKSAGKIPFADHATAQHWEDLLVSDPSKRVLLDKMPARAPIMGTKITTGSMPAGTSRAVVETVSPDQVDVLRAYIRAGSPRERALVYACDIDPVYARKSRVDFARFPVEGANVLGEVVGNIISQRTLSLVNSNRPLLRGIVTDFSSEAIAKGQSIYTRLVSQPTVRDFGSTDSDTAVTDYPVTLSAHKEVKFGFTPTEYLSTSRNLVEEHAEAMAVAIGNHLVDVVAALITDAFTSETTGAADAKSYEAIVTASKALNAAGAPARDRFMWLNTNFAAALENDELILEHLEQKISPDAYLHYRNIRGFSDIWEYPSLPSNSINLIGFAFQRNALILATRVAADPQSLVNASYPGRLSVVTDAFSGFSVLSDRWIDAGTRKINTRLDVLYGVARGLVNCGHKFVTS